MAEIANGHSAQQQPATVALTDLPVHEVLSDGSKLLAETSAFLILEKDVHTKKCGALANEHRIQLVRLPTDTKGRPSFKLLVHPREGEARDVKRAMLLDTRCSMTPALKRIRRETHFVKPDGESLLRAISQLDGEEIKLYVFEVRRAAATPLLGLLRLGGGSVLRLGFRDLGEALAWYIYIAVCANVMAENDPDFSKVIQHQSLARHAATTPALLLQFDDVEPQEAAPAAKTAAV